MRVTTLEEFGKWGRLRALEYVYSGLWLYTYQHLESNVCPVGFVRVVTRDAPDDPYWSFASDGWPDYRGLSVVGKNVQR